MTPEGSLAPSVRCGRINPPILLGAVGGLLFLFVFPRGSITTLMHDVLHLPGPGAGIALLLGPVALLFILLATHSVQRAAGGGLAASLAFALAYTIPVKLLALPANEKGMFGSIWFILALVACGLVAEILLFLSRGLRPSWRFLLTACGANTVLLVFYWLVIFPRTKGWIAWEDVPLLLVLSLAGGAITAVLAWAAATRIPALTDFLSRRHSNVRTR
jgi:hypothetical protein